MSSNGVNVDDADMAECDGEKVVTMMDVLQEQQEFEDDANAVLGASDDKNCTYSKGYIKRQALYACLTCCSDAREDPTARAGVCLACSLACHENHDLVELYTKRNFRCDCGNPKFSQPCTYTQNKTQLNNDNSYNQNFSGLYCTCHRPYPDPEGIEEEMIQCVICEDWLHASHLEATIPSTEIYAEMICKACMEKNVFLHDYSEYAVNDDVDVVGIDENDSSAVCNGDSKINGVDAGDSDRNITVTEETVNSNGDGEKLQMNGNSIEVTDDTLTNDNLSVEQTEPKNSIPENDEDNSVEKLNKESDITGVDESTADKTVSDEQSSISNMDMEIVKEKVDGLATDTNEITANDNNAVNNTNGNSKDDCIESNPEDKLDESSSKAPVAGAVNISESLTNSEDMEEGQNPKRNETESKNFETETKTDVSDTISDELETKTDNSDTKTDELETNTDEFITNKIDEPKTKSDESEIKFNETETKTDESETKINETETKSDESEINTDKTETKIEEPDTKSDESETKIDEPETKSEESETKADEFEKKAELVTKSDESEIKSDEPETKSDEIETKTVDTEIELMETNTNDVEKGVSERSLDEIPKEQQDPDLEKPKDSLELNDNSSAVEQDTEMDGSYVSNNKMENQSKEHKRKFSTDETDDISVKKPKLEGTKCARPKRGKWFKGATFWPSYFRQKLCTCSECLAMYKDLSVLFLLDLDDTVTAYETLGKERRDGTSSTSSYEKGLEALSSLDRIQQINALTEYNKMRDKLLDFLKSFKDRREVVKEEDIKAFFAGMKPKREPDGVYFCR